MGGISRREFVISLLGTLSQIAIGRISFAAEESVKVNLPAYRLEYHSREGIFTYDVGIGRDYAGRPPTPVGKGFLTDKRKRVIFRYGNDYPQYHIKAGEVIRWTNTYDDDGNPVGYRMPYNRMRAIGMKLYDGERTFTRYVLHSTTDEFTIGTPCSSGCLRFSMDDMLDLFRRVKPEHHNSSGYLNIPIKIDYRTVELSGDKVLLHADVYDHGIDYGKELEDLIGYYDDERFARRLSDAKKMFADAHEKILKKLLRGFPYNYLSDELKSRLHLTVPIEELI